MDDTATEQIDLAAYGVEVTQCPKSGFWDVKTGPARRGVAPFRFYTEAEAMAYARRFAADRRHRYEGFNAATARMAR